jgi:signal transduction histidine kinase
MNILNKRKIVYGLTFIVVTISFIFLILFNILMNLYVENSARSSLELMKHTFDINAEFFVDYDFNENLYFEPYYAIIDDDYVEEMVPSEIELYKYYKSASKNLEYGESYRYTNKGKTIYFMLLERVIVDDTYFENDDPKNILIYVNISPVASIVSTINKIFAVVFFLIIVFVVWIGKKTDKYLEMSDKNLKSFFSNASHELKTPIMSIQSYAEGIEKEIVDEKEAAQIIIKESERMSNLVGDILEISKIDSGAKNLNAYYSDLREVLYDILESNTILAEKSNIEFKFKLNEPLMTVFDEQMMHSVFSNIVSNNIRYAKSKVEVHVIKNSKFISIKISDDGEPILEENIIHVFDRFYKGKNGQNGIGLALAKEYIELHDGNIRVISNEEETAFLINIPNIKK